MRTVARRSTMKLTKLPRFERGLLDETRCWRAQRSLLDESAFLSMQLMILGQEYIHCRHDK